MDFYSRHQLLNESFNTNKVATSLSDLSATIINCRFESGFPTFAPVNTSEYSMFDSNENDILIRQNNSFTYPVFVPKKLNENGKAIVLLHGLNERSWDKYLVWADFLAEQTNQMVILFPIAFHMNRSPESWNNARTMSKLASLRKSFSPDATYVNAALSARIENYPEQFLISGMQSYLDVVKLVKSIKEGVHPLFRKNTGIDIFSYSIGAFLSELLVFDNPENLFTDSKLCLFCGGATFDSINGASRFIMDSRAFQRLRTLVDFKNFARLRRCLNLKAFKEFKNSWETLRFMTFLKEGRLARENAIKKIGEQIYAIGLVKDTVVPPSAILQTLKTSGGKLLSKVDVFDFSFPYCHESPFPVNNSNFRTAVDTGFRQVFERAASFLM